MSTVSDHKAIVEKYFDGARRGDHQQVLSCVTDDVLFEIYGKARVRGRAALEAALNAIAGHPTLTVDRLIEAGDIVVVVGSGSVALAAGGGLEFRFCDVFTFSGDAISRLESYQVSLDGSSG